MHISGGFEQQARTAIRNQTNFHTRRWAFQCLGAILCFIAVSAFKDEFIAVTLFELEEFFTGNIARPVRVSQVSREFCNIDQILSCMESPVVRMMEIRVGNESVHIF